MPEQPGHNPNINLGSMLARDAAGPEDVLPLSIMAANRVVGDFESARRDDRLQIANLEAAQLVDARTGLLNSTGYFREIDAALASPDVQSGAATVTVTVIDVDRFKQVNDQLGHPMGDELIRLVGGVVADQAQRATDRLAHGAREAANLGGDEFAIVSTSIKPAAGDHQGRGTDATPLAQTPPTLEQIIANPLADSLNAAFQTAIQGTPFEQIEGLRLSAGQAVGQQGDTALSVHQAADAAMFVNKYGERINQLTDRVVTPEDLAQFQRDVQGLRNLGVRLEPWLIEAERRLMPPQTNTSI